MSLDCCTWLRSWWWCSCRCFSAVAAGSPGRRSQTQVMAGAKGRGSHLARLTLREAYPLNDAEPARARLRDHGRLADRLFDRDRRPTREPEHRPVPTRVRMIGRRVDFGVGYSSWG